MLKRYKVRVERVVTQVYELEVTAAGRETAREEALVVADERGDSHNPETIYSDWRATKITLDNDTERS